MYRSMDFLKISCSEVSLDIWKTTNMIKSKSMPPPHGVARGLGPMQTSLPAQCAACVFPMYVDACPVIKMWGHPTVNTSSVLPLCSHARSSSLPSSTQPRIWPPSLYFCHFEDGKWNHGPYILLLCTILCYEHKKGCLVIFLLKGILATSTWELLLIRPLWKLLYRASCEKVFISVPTAQVYEIWIIWKVCGWFSKKTFKKPSCHLTHQVWNIQFLWLFDRIRYFL